MIERVGNLLVKLAVCVALLRASAAVVNYFNEEDDGPPTTARDGGPLIDTSALQRKASEDGLAGGVPAVWASSQRQK